MHVESSEKAIVVGSLEQDPGYEVRAAAVVDEVYGLMQVDIETAGQCPCQRDVEADALEFVFAPTYDLIVLTFDESLESRRVHAVLSVRL
jgi:hypothetical protein